MASAAQSVSFPLGTTQLEGYLAHPARMESHFVCALIPSICVTTMAMSVLMLMLMLVFVLMAMVVDMAISFGVVLGIVR